MTPTQAMDSPPTLTGQKPLTELISGIVTDAQRLFKQQIDMVRAEFKEDMRYTRQVAQAFAVGAVMLAVGAIMLLVAGVHLLAYLSGLPMWACWGIVGGSAVLIGGIAVAIGARTLASYNPLPDKSFNALQENVSWITNPQS